ncbi:hypothetical protein KAW44_00455, partial [Candidatus Bipolaricaulota bacterium]|nr:hypothetical protein [Candidatus Bipolaricaulota bacterium]
TAEDAEDAEDTEKSGIHGLETSQKGFSALALLQYTRLHMHTPTDEFITPLSLASATRLS